MLLAINGIKQDSLSLYCEEILYLNKGVCLLKKTVALQKIIENRSIDTNTQKAHEI